MVVLDIIYYILMGASVICQIIGIFKCFFDFDNENNWKWNIIGTGLLGLGMLILLINVIVDEATAENSLRYICPLCDNQIDSLFCPDCGTKATIDQLN